MHEAQRVEHIERLIDGIKLIGPGAMFERFGAKFLDHHLDAGLVHRGVNTQNNPVGGTVDSVDDAGKVAAEYSIEKDYFQAQWAKPTKDVLHVVKNHPKVEDIYLLSSQTSTVAEIKAAQARVGAWPGFVGKTIHYYDARRIAEVIVDEVLLDDAAIRSLREHLPVLDRILNEHLATLTPRAVDPRRIDIQAVDDALDVALTEDQPVAALSGLAGSGKSDAAAAYVERRRDRYKMAMWVEGGDLTTVADLSAKQLWQGGAALNVAGLLKTRPCLLVIDDLSPGIRLDELKPLCGPGSRIVVTRRETEAGDISVPAFNAAEAQQVLDRDAPKPCPETVLDLLMQTVGGHPLSLALVNRATLAGVSWDEIAEACDGIAELVDRRERLADRILGRLKGFLASELAVFEWLGQARCDHRFLKAVIGPLGLLKIRGQGLEAVDRTPIFRLHDVVYASLKVQGWLSDDRAAELDARLDKHLAVLIEEESLALLVLATTLRRKLESVVGQRYAPGALVALLALWRPEELDRERVGDPATQLAAIEALGAPAPYVEVRFILEAIESLYRADKIASMDAAKAQLEARLPLFERLLALEVENPISHAEARHHWGKALKILGREAEAAAQFEAVMAGPHPSPATRLQLIRLHAGKDDRAVELADEILTAAQTPLTVISSVVLGVVEDLSWARGTALDALFQKHGDLIEREIVTAADAGLAQAYAALASVGRYWAWHEPNRLRKIFDAIPVQDIDEADDRTSGAMGEILLKLAKSKFPPNRDFQERAILYFRSIAEPQAFQLQKLGEVLIDLRRFAEAEATLRRIPDLESDTFATYRLSQARLGQDDPNGALMLIDQALAGLDAGKQHFVASFWAHRFKIREAAGDSGAVGDLDAAIAACEPGKYLEHLKTQRRKLS